LKLYSVVIPVFNSEKLISITVGRIRDQFLLLSIPFEIILINDGSGDDSWGVISSLAKEFPEVIAINLLKNYGQHNANLCGFRESRGSYVITMDDDLQNPPEEISKFILAAKNGYDLVIGKFQKKQHPLHRQFGSKFVGWLNRKIFNISEQLTLSNFRIIRRDVVDRICQDRGVDPYIPGLLLKYSSNRANILITHLPRSIGKSNYSIPKLIRLVASILFVHSSYPLRLSIALGFILAGSSFLMGLYFLLQALFSGNIIPGWASLAVMISFFNGFLVLTLSIIGEYVMRILREVRHSSSYQIKEVVGK
jgi:glycosyltransferase involved in cell wall biosynthesis